MNGVRHKLRPILATLLSITAVVTAIWQPTPAAAASTYNLTWAYDKGSAVLNLDQSKLIIYSKAVAAPVATVSAASGDPCYGKTLDSAFGKFLSVVGKTVTNGSSTQYCEVTLKGGSNGSYRPTPATISNKYLVTSSARIDLSFIAPEAWCVSRCDYVDGANIAITRSRDTKVCTQWATTRSLGNAGWEEHGVSWSTTCPQTITISAPAASKGGENFTVEAKSNLGHIVTLSASGGNCDVVTTATTQTHVVFGQKKGNCNLTAYSPASSNSISPGVPWYSAATATKTVTITSTCDANCTPEKGKIAQTITVSAPTNAMELDSVVITATASSNLPVALTPAAGTSCSLLNSTATMLQYAPNATCTLTASQPGNDPYDAAPNVEVVINVGCSKLHSCKPPTAQPDAFSYPYGSAITGNLTANDTIYTSGTKAELVANNAPGTVSIDATSGNFTFQPTSKYFTGSASFTYQLTDTMQQSSAAVTVALSVVAPPPPAPPTPDATLGVRAAPWMRLNVDEAITLLPTLTCAAASVQGAKCGTHAADGGIVGSYIEVTSMRVTGFNVTLPNGYPTSRYTLLSNPTGAQPAATAFASGVAARLRFQQATTANSKIRATISYTATYKAVTWTRYNGVLAETVVSSGTTLFANAAVQFGVIGATS